ncbi:2TM domain-containing protein [Roseateles sp. DAIF2]|uniref:2TM domain-containing protein n=1 Tax=Roseateles sp. DAIF2 TaxID=2714952 RepID=UPI0018BF953E|nr:2TM domain-containing protein [Roseateles sp. DAIF2]QPF76189.1 2TM domain-containing protein [Roseateles sp. DAIF2]
MTTTTMTHEQPHDDPGAMKTLQRQARRRVDMKLGWLTHALVFVLVNTGLFLLNGLVTGGRAWHLFPLWGWGLGLAIHGLVVLLALGSGGGLRQRMLAAELGRLKQQQQRRSPAS